MSRILIRIKRLILPPMTYEKRPIIKAYSLRVLSSISDSSFWLRRSLRIASLFLCATISSCSWYSCCARAFRSINFSSVASKTPKIGALESGSSAGMGRGLQRTYKHASHYITVQNDCKVLGPGDLTNSAWLCLPSTTIVEVWIETSVACARRSYSGVRAAHPLAVFPAPIYLPRPHYLNAWNSLQTRVKGYQLGKGVTSQMISCLPYCKLSKLAFAKLLYCLRPNSKYIASISKPLSDAHTATDQNKASSICITKMKNK